jgi:hypothetical protein
MVAAALHQALLPDARAICVAIDDSFGLAKTSRKVWSALTVDARPWRQSISSTGVIAHAARWERATTTVAGPAIARWVKAHLKHCRKGATAAAPAVVRVHCTDVKYAGIVIRSRHRDFVVTIRDGPTHRGAYEVAFGRRRALERDTHRARLYLAKCGAHRFGAHDDFDAGLAFEGGTQLATVRVNRRCVHGEKP